MGFLRFAALCLVAGIANAVGVTTGSMDGGPALPQAGVQITTQPGQPAASPSLSTGAVACGLSSVQDRAGTPSSTCMTCHDGSQAADARTGHRYDIDYTSAFDPNLRPNPQQFIAAIVLSNGKVTCLTCHDPASTLDFHLAGPLDGLPARRLCVACHPLE